jgi:hypothetical protein
MSLPYFFRSQIKFKDIVQFNRGCSETSVGCVTRWKFWFLPSRFHVLMLNESSIWELQGSIRWV